MPAGKITDECDYVITRVPQSAAGTRECFRLDLYLFRLLDISLGSWYWLVDLQCAGGSFFVCLFPRHFVFRDRRCLVSFVLLPVRCHGMAFRFGFNAGPQRWNVLLVGRQGGQGPQRLSL